MVHDAASTRLFPLKCCMFLQLAETASRPAACESSPVHLFQELVVTLPVHTTWVSLNMTLPFHGRGYLVDTGQEFVNTRGPGGNAEPFQFDTGMGVLPEAIDMTGEHCLAWCTFHMSE